jgi:uncharacterized protein (TIGR03067 family)
MRLALLLLVILAIGADAPQHQADKELADLQGEWTAVSFEANGDSVSTANAGWKIIVKGKTILVRFGAVSFDGKLVLDSAGQPKQLDIIETKWGQAPAKMDISGIYKLEQGRLTVCYRFGSQTPPSEFRTAIGTNTMIQVFKQTK